VTADELTADELQRLRLVRARALLDRGDLAPMLWVSTDEHGLPVARVVPLIEAVNMETRL
jgi:hypothetical protein